MPTYPLPLSEVTPVEADQILSLPRQQRDRRLMQLRNDISSGAHARRERHRELDAGGA